MPTAMESLEIIRGVLQRMALPAISDNPNQLSHMGIAQHVQNIAAALQIKTEEPTNGNTSN